ncbi:Arc family DNA-binding protein [Acinetobacter pittii]|uniref:Arc family DNA-binding protein n=1 Tax=Acinetobacter pittii TaxID=48296 RepID=UPI002AFE6044|nr:Arc family DNA-binding protein [Acinetobacter pittii]
MIFKQDDWKRSQLRLPADLHERLIKFAEKNGLSMNTALIEIIEKSLDSDISLSKLTVLESLKNIEGLLKSKEFEFDRNSEVATRLVDCLRMTNEITSPNLTPSKVAELLGEESAAKFSDYFTGISEPSFNELEKFANFFGVNEGWLKHGNLPKFNVDYFRMSLNPEIAISELLNLNNKFKDKPICIYLIRNQTKAGELLIIRKYSDWNVDVLTTPMHISNEIGAGGFGMLKSFFVTLRILYQLYTSTSHKNTVNVRGYIVRNDKFDDISEGMLHPLTLLKNQTNNTWWEDIWDSSMYKKNEYWDGFVNIAQSIQEGIKDDKYLSNIVDKVQKHELDILKPY